MDAVRANLFSDASKVNNSRWRVWYNTVAVTTVSQLGISAITSITPVLSGGKYFGIVVLTDANHMDGVCLRVGDKVNLICTGADSAFSACDDATPCTVVAVNVGASIVVNLPRTTYTGTASSGTLVLKNPVRKAIFAGFKRTAQTANTSAYVIGPDATLTLPITVATSGTQTVEEPAGSSFFLSDWSYKLGTANDVVLVTYK